MKKRIYVLLCIGFVVIVFYFYFVSQKTHSVNIEPQTLYPVTGIIDGDTIRVRIQRTIVTVRLLGINTPETFDPRREVECFGPEASEKIKELLFNQKVFLKLNPKREVFDKYGRYLAYVYRSDGLFINEKLLSEGYAREYTYGKPYSFVTKFKALEKKARTEKRGLWGKCK